MASEVRLPRLGWSMEEGKFVGWLKADGDRVSAGDPLFELEGEKALQEVESLDAGVLRICPNGPKEGDVVQVGALLAYLVAEGEAAPFEAAGVGPVAASAALASTEPPPAAPSVRRLAREVGVPLQTIAGSGPGGRILASDVVVPEPSVVFRSAKDRPFASAIFPKSLVRLDSAETAQSQNQSEALVVRSSVRVAGIEPAISEKSPTIASPRAKRMARELGVDWTHITGTGTNGRVRERDVRAATTTSLRSILITSRRRTIAQRMVASLQQTAPVTLTRRVDATALVAARNQYKTANTGVVPAYTDLIAKCVAQALCEHPLLGGRWADDRLEYPTPDGMHIGIAVDTEDGLLVPVVRDVARRPLMELAAEFRSLVEQARTGQIKANQMQGAVFTITSLGSFGVEAFTPIINLPETAILGVGAIRKELVVLDNGSFAAREQLMLSLTFDHRVIDGAPAARFLQCVTEAIQAAP